MSLEQEHVIDAIGIDRETGHIVLTIADSWDWADKNGHLLALQAKINAYLEFIESKQINDAVPGASEKPITIDIVTKYPMPISGIELLEKTHSVASDLNVTVSHRHLPVVTP